MYKTIVILIAIFSYCAYLFFSKPDSLVINESGKIEGLANKGRAMLQGERFWKNQLKLATGLFNTSTKPHLPSSEEMQTLYNKLRMDESELNDRMKELYTPEERMAVLYRIKADSIERAGKWKKLDKVDEELRTVETDKLKIIIPLIEGKLHIVKPD